MGKLRLIAAAVVLAIAPLVWTGTIAPPAQLAHTHDASGKEIALAGNAMSAPVANAHTIGTILRNTESTATHVRLVVRVMASSTRLYGGCWALDNGGTHHSHRITACHLRDPAAGGTVLRGSCSTSGGYGPCSFSTADQHWHTPSAPKAGCWQAVGGFDVTGHSHQTLSTTSVCYV